MPLHLVDCPFSNRQALFVPPPTVLLASMAILGRRLTALGAVVFCVAKPAIAFCPPRPGAIVRAAPLLWDVSSVPKEDGSGLSYSERSRPFRRDVFAYDDWVRHRTADRFTGRFAMLTKSGIARALAYETQVLALVATFICLFNALAVVGYDDFSGIHHDPLINIGLPTLALPSMFFTLSSPALSLLLGTCRAALVYSSALLIAIQPRQRVHDSHLT